MKFRAALMLVSLLIAGCHETVTGAPAVQLPPGTPPSVKQDVEQALGKAASLPDSGKARLQSLGSNAAAATAFLSNTTARSYSVSHGSQIEYLSANGTTSLWYPGNTVPVPGRWKVQQSGDRAKMCFLYGQATYNPVTKEVGGNWECEPLRFYLLLRVEIVPGDPLKLGSKGIPFVLPRADISIAQAMAKAGIAGNPQNKIDW